MPRISQSQFTYNTSDGTSTSFTIDVGTGAGRFASLYVGMNNGSNSVTAATIDGVAMTISTVVNDLSKNVHRIYLPSISGTGNVTCQLTFANTNGLARIGYIGRNGISSVRSAPAMVKASGSTVSDTVTTVSGDIVEHGGWEGDNGVTFAATSPATTVLAGSVIYAAKQTASGTSTTIAGTLSAGGIPWGGGSLVLVPAAGGGGGSSIAAINYHYSTLRRA